VIRAHRADREAWEAAAEVAATVGVQLAEDAIALGSTNHVWLLDEPALALNVAPAGRDPDELADRLVGARFLADLGVFTSLAEGFASPVVTRQGRLVTVWDRVDVQPGPPDWQQVGELLQRIAEADIAALGDAVNRLRRVDDLTDIIETIDLLLLEGRLSFADAAMLHRIAGRLAIEIDHVRAGQPRVVVHGDLWPPNLLVSPQGMVLCDADEVGTGPADWDLAALLDWGRQSSSGRPREQLLTGWRRTGPTAGPAEGRRSVDRRWADRRRADRRRVAREAQSSDLWSVGSSAAQSSAQSSEAQSSARSLAGSSSEESSARSSEESSAGSSSEASWAGSSAGSSGASWEASPGSWSGEPTTERIRCLTRIAHLRRTLRLLHRRSTHPRDLYWDAVRLEGWRRVDRDWTYQAFPELHLSRPQQLQHLLTQGRASAWRRLANRTAWRR
jgi:aminoglycoside phosphotransferase (APT) family kinase protein